MIFLQLKKYGILLLFASFYLQAQSNCTLVGHLPYPQGLSNLWGYAANGREYAIVGTETGTAVVDVTEPGTATEVGFIDGGQTIWREIKTFGHYAYVVEEEAPEGLVVIDLSQLPDTITATNWYGAGNVTFNTAHTLYIDENGILYVFGANHGVGGAIMADLNVSPTNPPVLGVFNERYIHDGYVRNDTLWAAEINDGQVDVVNVTNKSNPVVMASFNTPNNFSHNCWLSDDGNTLYTTDEVFGAYVAAYNVNDINDIKEMDRVQSNPGSFSPPHNTYVVNQNFLATSYYTDGVVIFDATHPDNLIQVGNYDTSPLTGGDFNGDWGVYPYLPSQNLLVSDMQEGLFIIRPNYVQAAYLRGTISNAADGNPISGVSVTIVNGSAPSSNSNFGGQYASGTVQSGTYSVQFSKPGYSPLTVDAVTLTSGIETTLNVSMTALPSFTLTGVVLDNTGVPIPGAQVLFTNNDGLLYETTSIIDGSYSIPSFINGTYDIMAGQWGYVSNGITASEIAFNAAGPMIVLEQGYYDDFALDFGWTSSGTTQLGGEWGKGDPIGTTFNGLPITFQPENDLPNDFGNQCYVTGNTGDFLDMVDGGNVTLTSPIFDLSNYNEPILNFNLWFMSASQTGAGTNDDVYVRLNNGIETVTLLHIGSETTNPFGGVDWQNYSFNINDFTTPTANMQLSVQAIADFNQFELLEVGFDGFSVIDSSDIVGINLPVQNTLPQISVMPNPTNGMAHFFANNNNTTSDLYIVVYDMTGKEIQRKALKNGQCDIYMGNMASGLYLYSLIDQIGNKIASNKLIVE